MVRKMRESWRAFDHEINQRNRSAGIGTSNGSLSNTLRHPCTYTECPVFASCSISSNPRPCVPPSGALDSLVTALRLPPPSRSHRASGRVREQGVVHQMRGRIDPPLSFEIGRPARLHQQAPEKALKHGGEARPVG